MPGAAADQENQLRATKMAQCADWLKTSYRFDLAKKYLWTSFHPSDHCLRGNPMMHTFSTDWQA
jgi:hypothetical protein